MTSFAIPYNLILAEIGTTGIETLMQALTQEWVDAYAAMTPHAPNVLQFQDHDFQFLFDFSSEYVTQGRLSEHEAVEDRVIVAFGHSHASSAKRDVSRMRGFLGGPLIAVHRGRKKRSDKGHFMGHSLGGGLDVNLFPQGTTSIAAGHRVGESIRRWNDIARSILARFAFHDQSIKAELGDQTQLSMVS